MIALVVPDAVPWEATVRERLGPHRVFRAPRLCRPAMRLPARWSIPARLHQRRLAGRLAARWLPADTTQVVAPSLAAGRPFAEAARRGLPTLLLEDLPDLLDLTADLDRAAQHHPDDAFLRNVRPPRALALRQRGERRVADEVRLQGRHASRRREGQPLFPRIEHPPAGRLPGGRVRARLAGPALTRTGILEALDALDRLSWLALEARLLAESPDRARDHPRLVPPSDQRPDVVLAPSWVEAWPAEVRQAAAHGVPIVGTERALGWEDGIVVPVGDGEAIVRALESLRA